MEMAPSSVQKLKAVRTRQASHSPSRFFRWRRLYAFLPFTYLRYFFTKRPRIDPLAVVTGKRKHQSGIAFQHHTHATMASYPQPWRTKSERRMQVEPYDAFGIILLAAIIRTHQQAFFTLVVVQLQRQTQTRVGHGIPSRAQFPGDTGIGTYVKARLQRGRELRQWVMPVVDTRQRVQIHRLRAARQQPCHHQKRRQYQGRNIRFMLHYSYFIRVCSCGGRAKALRQPRHFLPLMTETAVFSPTTAIENIRKKGARHVNIRKTRPPKHHFSYFCNT